mmetsp:Transcript_77828/g.137239  ORF Transcript_77828/g.137239 Transcript_77828/m.137239 type:complete len:910 (+) Transcript_77828:102-2831(+)
MLFLAFGLFWCGAGVQDKVNEQLLKLASEEASLASSHLAERSKRASIGPLGEVFSDEDPWQANPVNDTGTEQPLPPNTSKREPYHVSYPAAFPTDKLDAFVAFIVVIMVSLTAFLLRQMFTKITTPNFRLDWISSYLSSLQLFVVIVIMQAIDPASPQNEFYRLLTKVGIPSIMFWHAFLGSRTYGESIMHFWNMLAGLVAATLCYDFLNFIIPSGEACYYDKQCPYNPAYLVKREHFKAVSVAFGGCATLPVYMSNIALDFKRVYGLTMGLWVLQHLNPEAEARDFTPFILGNGRWETLALLNAYLLRLLLQYWLPLKSLTLGNGHNLAIDALELSIMDERANQKVRLRRAVLGLGEQDNTLAESKSLLDFAWWECLTFQRRSRFQQCEKALQHLEDVEDLLVALAILETRRASDFFVDSALLDSALGGMIQKIEEWVDMESRSDSLTHDVELTADEALNTIQQMLQSKSLQPSDAAILYGRVSTCLQHTLREEVQRAEDSDSFNLKEILTSGMKQLLPESGTPLRGAGCSNWCWAIFMTYTWMHTLVLGMENGHYRSTANTTACLMMMLPPPLLLDSLERHATRILGMSAGLVGLALPNHWFCAGLQEFASYPHDVYAYLCTVLVIWTLLAYGALSSAKYGYACSTAAAFGVGIVLAPWGHVEKDNQVAILNAYAMIMHAFNGMLVLTCALFALVFFTLPNHTGPALATLLTDTYELLDAIAKIGGKRSTIPRGSMHEALQVDVGRVRLKMLDDLNALALNQSARSQAAYFLGGQTPKQSLVSHLRAVKSLVLVLAGAVAYGGKQDTQTVLPLVQLQKLATAVQEAAKPKSERNIDVNFAMPYWRLVPRVNIDTHLDKLAGAKDAMELRELANELLLEELRALIAFELARLSQEMEDRFFASECSEK